MYKRLKDTVTESRKLGKVSDFAFRCWTLGLAQADWFGRLPADPEKYLTIVFPNRRSVGIDEVRAALDELAESNLIHLYETSDGDRFQVYHKHDEHNPSGGWKSKPCKYPHAGHGICACIKYNKQESPKSSGGKEFRFFPGLFPTARRKVASGHSDPSDQCSSPLLSSPLLSSHAPLILLSSLVQEGGVGGGEKRPEGINQRKPLTVLLDEFTSLTGYPPLYGVKYPDEMMHRLEEIIEVRGIERLVDVMRKKASDCAQRHGRPPSTMQYFIPIFEDPNSFGNGTVNGGKNGKRSTSEPGVFAIPDGEFGRMLAEQFAERNGSAGSGTVDGDGGGKAGDACAGLVSEDPCSTGPK